MQVPSTGERGPINDAFKHAQQVPVRIPSERGEDQILVLFGQFLQDGDEFWMQRNLPLLPVFGDESLFGLCSNGEDAFDQIKIGPMEVGKFLLSQAGIGECSEPEFASPTWIWRASIICNLLKLQGLAEREGFALSRPIE